MAWVSGYTSNDITWLDCYGLYREAGINQYMTQEALDGNSEFVLATQADLQAGADAAAASSDAAMKYAGDVLMGIGAIVLGAAGGTIAGAVIGALLVAVGAILSFFAELFTVECDKYHCGGHDRKTSAQKDRYSEHVKALVGVQVVDKSSWDLREVDCACDKRNHRCTFIRFMHDGLVIEGVDWDFVDAEPSQSGQVRGANGIQIIDRDGRFVANVKCAETWRTSSGYGPLTSSGDLIPWGGEKFFYPDPEKLKQWAEAGEISLPDGKKVPVVAKGASGEANALYTYWITIFGSEDEVNRLMAADKIMPPWEKPWRCDPNTYYYRAWRVQKILYWMTGYLFRYENVLCRTMECMEEVFDYTVAVGDDSSNNQRRRRGSRWYASIVWMMTDIWKAGQALVAQAKTPEEGWTQFGQILMDSGVGDTALDELRQMADGKIYKTSEAPWPFYPLMKYITLAQMRLILENLKPLFPYVYEAPIEGPSPYGAGNRTGMPLVTPILGPISINLRMEPIPAKLGKSGPGLGTIMLGLGAAALGAYAIYKFMAPAEQE